ncbi:MAG: flagellar protein FlbB [Spirochaetales bacterium]|nr:MAG: flagellar protein FlbB [Spirochaetales bacterium]
MRTYSRGGGFARIFFLVILIIALLIGGLVWLDFLGIIDVKDRLAPFTSLFGVRPRTEVEEPFSPLLLDADRLEKERQAVRIERTDLETRSGSLDLREAEVRQKESELSEKERSLKEKENSLIEAVSQYDNIVANLEQTARHMKNMPPADAVAIMDEYDLRDLVDLLRTSERLSMEAGESSLVPYWISLMADRTRAAEIERMMVEKPGVDLDR